MGSVTVDGHHLELKDAEAVVFDRAPVSIDPSALEALERAREVLSREAAERPIYGVNTGLGKFSSVVIGPGDLERLQRNL